MVNPAFTFFLFCGLSSFVAYFIYLRFILRALGGNDSGSVPKRVRTTLNTLAEGVVILDNQNQIVMANEAFAEVLGGPPPNCKAARYPISPGLSCPAARPRAFLGTSS